MKVKILNNIAKTGLDILEKEGFSLHQNDDLDGCSGIVLRSQNLTQEKLPESIFGIARAGAGTNNINVEDCSQNGVVVFNTPGANSNAVKELVIASLFLSSRGIVQGINHTRDTIITEDINDLSSLFLLTESTNSWICDNSSLFNLLDNSLFDKENISFNDIFGIFLANKSTCGSGIFKTRPISRIEDLAAILP